MGRMLWLIAGASLGIAGDRLTRGNAHDSATDSARTPAVATPEVPEILAADRSDPAQPGAHVAAVPPKTPGEAATSAPKRPRQSAPEQSPTPEAVRPRESAPELTLARMPGTNRLRNVSRFDAESGAWVLTQTLQVPAALAHVESFYRRALAEAGLQVSGATTTDDEDGSKRAFIKGRGRRVHASVSVRQPPNRLRTRVRIMWRVWPK